MGLSRPDPGGVSSAGSCGDKSSLRGVGDLEGVLSPEGDLSAHQLLFPPPVASSLGLLLRDFDLSLEYSVSSSSSSTSPSSDSSPLSGVSSDFCEPVVASEFAPSLPLSSSESSTSSLFSSTLPASSSSLSASMLSSPLSLFCFAELLSFASLDPDLDLPTFLPIFA